MPVVNGHMLVVAVWERLLLTAEQSSKWFCPLCLQSKLPVSGLSLLQPQTDEVSTALTDIKHPDVSKTSLQHSHSENHAKKPSAKDKNYYYERHKVRILSNRKQQYQKNVETERAASRLRAKVNYAKNPDPKKDV